MIFFDTTSTYFEIETDDEEDLDDEDDEDTDESPDEAQEGLPPAIARHRER